MTRLFIIGNGFDIYHGLSTSYKDFKEYLKNYDNKKLYHNYFPAAVSSEAGRVDTTYFLYEILNQTIKDKDKWSDFEEALGELDCNKMLTIKDPKGNALFDESYSFDGRFRVNQAESNRFDYGWSCISRFYLTSMEVGVSGSAICNAIRGKAKSSGGYIWKWHEE